MGKENAKKLKFLGSYDLEGFAGEDVFERGEGEAVALAGSEVNEANEEGTFWG